MRELSLHILDAMENSIEAGATRIEVTIDENVKQDRLSIVVKDNGRGMSEELMREVLDPFVTTRTTRHVGLGLPLFAAASRRCNGDLEIRSQPGAGTTVTATFQHSHIDRAPLGDIVSTLMATIMSRHAVDVRYEHRADGRTFELDTADVRRELGAVPLTDPLVRDWLEVALSEGVASVQEVGS